MCSNVASRNYGYQNIVYLFDIRRASQTAAKVRSAREVSIDQPTVTTATTPSIAAVPDQSIASNFHKELRDTCVDMLSRYVYFTSSSIPTRLMFSQHLFHLCL